MLDIVNDVLPCHFGEGVPDHGVHGKWLPMDESLQLVLLVEHFDFCESHFDWVELRRVDRVPARRDVESFHLGSHLFALVHIEVVHEEE